MEESNSKKKLQLKLTAGGGGGGIGGVVVLGGGLVVAGLMAVFTIVKNKNRRKDDKNEDTADLAAIIPACNQKTIQGLGFILQTPLTTVHQNPCSTSHGKSKIGASATQIDPNFEVVSTHHLVLEDHRVPIMDRKKENPTSYHPEICQHILSSEKYPLPRVGVGCPSLNERESMINNDGVEEELTVDETSTMQTIEEEDGTGEEHVTQKEEESSEGNLVVVEEDDDDDDFGEDAVEEEEDSSRLSSPMESNVGAIWSAEMLEALSPVNDINSGEKIIVEDRTAKREYHNFSDCNTEETTENSTMITNKETTQKLLLVNDPTLHLPKWRFGFGRHWYDCCCCYMGLFMVQLCLVISLVLILSLLHKFKELPPKNIQ